MRTEVVEADWRRFKILRERGLERLCQRALDDLVTMASDSNETPYDRFEAVYSKVREYRKTIDSGFDGLRRSRMVEQLCFMKSHGLIEDDELKEFTQETRDIIDRLFSHY